MAKRSGTSESNSPARRTPSVEASAIPLGLPKPRRGRATVVRSEQAFQGHIFSVFTEEIQEPDGVHVVRDVVRHNGSVVVLAVDEESNPADPLVVVEQQYRHAAGQYLLELPAGRIDPGEKPLPAAKRELIEETGFRARKWSRLVKYYASPGFVGEWMDIYLATGIVAGKAEPEDDEKIDVRLVPLSTMVELCLAGNVHDGKTLIGILLYAERRRRTLADARKTAAAAKRSAKKATEQTSD